MARENRNCGRESSRSKSARTLLQALAKASRPQMLRDLAAAAGMPPAKAHRYLVSFVRMGLVSQAAETGLYDLGAFALDLGLSALARLDPVAIAATALTELVTEIGQTVALAVWANQGPTIVRWLGPTRRSRPLCESALSCR